MKGLFIFAFVMSVLLIVGHFQNDSTDNGKKKSGMGLYIDNATGCHYLSSPFGQLIPRLDRHGNHICGGWAFEEEQKGKGKQ